MMKDYKRFCEDTVEYKCPICYLKSYLVEKDPHLTNVYNNLNNNNINNKKEKKNNNNN